MIIVFQWYKLLLLYFQHRVDILHMMEKFITLPLEVGLPSSTILLTSVYVRVANHMPPSVGIGLELSTVQVLKSIANRKLANLKLKFFSAKSGTRTVDLLVADPMCWPPDHGDPIQLIIIFSKHFHLCGNSLPILQTIMDFYSPT